MQPVYILLDTSGSMRGEPMFYLPQLPLRGGTSLGAGLECLMTEIDSQVQRRSATARGDYKPVVYLLTDGRPTDDFQSASATWREKYARRCDLIAIALGQSADADALKALTDKTYIFNPEAPQSYAQLARWVSASISIQSQSVNSTGVSLAKPDGNALSFLDKALAKTRSDEEVLIVPGKCSNTRQSYLLRYIPATRAPGLPSQYAVPGKYYLTGCYPVGASYSDWSDESLAAPMVNMNDLLGGAACPHCSNSAVYGIARDEGGPGDLIERGRG
jgi:uncharacterized protein YegL